MDVTSPMFDDQARRLRYARAYRLSGDRFLHARAFDECLDRLADIRRSFKDALITGFAEARWSDALQAIAPRVSVLAPGLEPAKLEPASVDLCLSIGELDAADDVQAAAFALRHLLRPGGLLIGAIVGGNSLPRLRSAMLAGDRATGQVSPRLHPMIDGPSLAALLTSVGLEEPVIDVDRVDVAYSNLDRLVADLRAMGCTNILRDRSRRPIARDALRVTRTAFLDGGNRTIERFELLHFAAWAPKL